MADPQAGAALVANGKSAQEIKALAQAFDFS